MRIGEAVGLPVSEVDSGRMVLRVIGKRKKERRVPLPASLLEERHLHYVVRAYILSPTEKTLSEQSEARWESSGYADSGVCPAGSSARNGR